ncbi:hypothetical protein TNCV_2821841 [Trichonephila clavipes]|uniref:Uncharacterized protein n=1 Tax=Trichonephila clavipes TaxID=2585209 RepID=A0A8X6WGF4_TRICX|nr:hypothetical protein TNCV_2821841 [Trichonephila clavipes]
MFRYGLSVPSHDADVYCAATTAKTGPYIDHLHMQDGSFAKSSFESRARSYQGYVFGASQVSYHPPAPILCRDCGDMRYATDKGTRYNGLIGRVPVYHATGQESLREKKGVAYTKTLINNQRNSNSTFQEAARATGLSKSEDFISEVVDDAPSVKNLTEEEHQERILRKQRAIK